MMSLSNDITSMIYEYVFNSTKMMLTRENYIKYHPFLRCKINKGSYDNYTRYIIRKDAYFVLEQSLNEKGDEWITNKKYNYKNEVYSDYLCFLSSYSLYNNSSNCRKLIQDFEKERRLGKNRFKKNSSTIIRWTN